MFPSLSYRSRESFLHRPSVFESLSKSMWFNLKEFSPLADVKRISIVCNNLREVVTYDNN